MLIGKTILGLSALVFISYGLISLISPGVPSGLAGLEMSNGDAISEIGAMYGGLQTGLGFFCLVALLKPEFYRSGLVLLVLGIGTLALARFITFVMTSDAVTAYTYGALIYEFATASLAAFALLKR